MVSWETTDNTIQVELLLHFLQSVETFVKKNEPE